MTIMILFLNIANQNLCEGDFFAFIKKKKKIITNNKACKRAREIHIFAGWALLK
jgi:hypothetical protein